MKKLLKLTPIILASLLFSGCFIQSFQPFYTEAAIVKPTAILGSWQLVERGDENVAEEYPEPWEFEVDETTTFEDGVSSTLSTTYFKVKNMTFVDFSPAEPEEEPNEWWGLHTIPVHSVCKITLSKETLIVTPLDGEWVQEMLEEKKISLSYIDIDIDSEDEHIVLTSSPEELLSFLKKHGNNSDAFTDDNAHIFQRTKP